MSASDPGRKGWQHYQGRAVALPVPNIDTDRLIPARFMSRSRAEGYGGFLLYDDRQGAAGAHVLDRYPDAGILVTGRNFGCGSSRESAVYALVDFGIRAVLAPGFGEIFASNAINQGLLAARLEEADAARVLALLADGALCSTIDLVAGTLILAGQAFGFGLDDTARRKLIHGWDDLGLTRTHTARIRDFAQERRTGSAWTWPEEPGGD